MAHTNISIIIHVGDFHVAPCHMEHTERDAALER